MKFYTSYVSKLKTIPDEFEKVIIMRFPPAWLDVSGIPNCSINKDLSPSDKVLLKYKEDGDWDSYYASFKEELMACENARKTLNEYKRLYKEGVPGTVVFFCIEKYNLRCHRSILEELFMNNGIQCEEWSGQDGRV